MVGGLRAGNGGNGTGDLEVGAKRRIKRGGPRDIELDRAFGLHGIVSAGQRDGRDEERVRILAALKG